MAVRLGIPEYGTAIALARRIAWVIGARLFVLGVALGAVALVHVSQGFDVGSEAVHLALVVLGAAFGLAGIYAAFLRSGRGLRLLADGQLVLDQLTWTVLVYLTGGITSGATSFYGLTCLGGAYLTGFRGAAVAAFAGAAAYVVLALSLWLGALEPPQGQVFELYAVTGEELSYYIIVNLLVIVVVTLLASNLAERLRATGGRLVVAEERAIQAERMAVLGRLATGLAHEIRNPLGSIAGCIQLLRQSPTLSEEERQLCDIVQAEASRLNDLVTDMMEVARPKKPTIAVVDAAEIAQEVVRLASKSGRAVSDVGIVFEGDIGAAPVHADGAQLRQLIWNLVRNAVQASRPRDRVVVRLHVRDDDEVEIAVEDDGVGIDPEARDRLFDAFFTTRSQGTGIGLAVVKRIADDHGFRIDVESERGQGATFRVHLGRRVAGPAQRDPGTAPLPVPGSAT